MEFVGVLDQTYTFNNSVCEGRFTVYLSNPTSNESTVVPRAKEFTEPVHYNKIGHWA